MVSDKPIHKAFRTHTTLFFLKQNPLEKFLIFTILPKPHCIHWLEGEIYRRYWIVEEQVRLVRGIFLFRGGSGEMIVTIWISIFISIFHTAEQYVMYKISFLDSLMINRVSK